MNLGTSINNYEKGELVRFQGTRHLLAGPEHVLTFLLLCFQSALFNFHSFLIVVLLGICTCTYVRMQFPAILEQRTGFAAAYYQLCTLIKPSFFRFRGFFWKAARIDRLYVLVCFYRSSSNSFVDDRRTLEPLGGCGMLHNGCLNIILLDCRFALPPHLVLVRKGMHTLLQRCKKMCSSGVSMASAYWCNDEVVTELESHIIGIIYSSLLLG
ncbi:Protein kish [Dillenia turbinata]|uniref:Protein kish n=1 Tax=Dillenia turbinata TaxID=194707 RepID=A0AAN8W4R6_9MAGN